MKTLTLCLIMTLSMLLCATMDVYGAQGEAQGRSELRSQLEEKERRIIEALNLASRQLSIGNRAVAKSIVEGVNETYPNDRRVTKQLADLEIVEKNWQRALELLIPTGFEKDRDGGDRFIRVGYLLAKVGRHQESRKMWSPDLIVSLGYTEWQLLLPNPGTNRGLEASWLLALSFNVHGRADAYDNPNRMLEEVLRLAPGNQIAAGHLAEVAWNTKQYVAAVRYCDIALKGCPPGPYKEGLLDTRAKAAAMIR